MKSILSILLLALTSTATTAAVLGRRGGSVPSPSVKSFTNINVAKSIVQDAILAIPSTANAGSTIWTFGGKDDQSATSSSYVQSYAVSKASGAVDYAGLVLKVDPPKRAPNFTPPEGAIKVFKLGNKIYTVTATVINTATQPIFAQVRVTVFDATTKAQIWTYVLPVSTPGANASGVIAVQDKAGNIYVSYAAGTSNPETTRTAKITVDGKLAWKADVNAFYPTALNLDTAETTVAVGYPSSLKLYDTTTGAVLPSTKIPTFTDEWPQSIIFSSSDIISSTRLGVYVNNVKKIAFTGSVVNAAAVSGGAVVVDGQITVGSYKVQRLSTSKGVAWTTKLDGIGNAVGVHADVDFAYVVGEGGDGSFIAYKFKLADGSVVWRGLIKNVVPGDSASKSLLDGNGLVLVTLKGALYRFV
ncbi:hypothetical protein HDU97_008092 [Phlyctochytrium planicorne]|nr:hypothetical protein HDU97_008092 [Phlyctochytrium planicorne]